eukprot:GHVR01178375.1.p1 GENE.GHVR01178375.1~~GHVR01178375.1.p1  ORF type:complete len:159 (-),score=13.02 GHVR01178375.1:1294-1713(-)
MAEPNTVLRRVSLAMTNMLAIAHIGVQPVATIMLNRYKYMGMTEYISVEAVLRKCGRIIFMHPELIDEFYSYIAIKKAIVSLGKNFQYYKILGSVDLIQALSSARYPKVALVAVEIMIPERESLGSYKKRVIDGKYIYI